MTCPACWWMILLSTHDETLKKDVPPELELLLCTARTVMDPARADRIKALLGEDIDWEYLLGLAYRHGLGSLLYWQLNATCPEVIPGNYIGQLQAHFHTNTRRNLLLAGELLRVIDLLEHKGIAAVPFKGPVLAASCYGNLGLREFEDLDLLVHEGDAPKVETLLLHEGFRPLFGLTSAQKAAVHKSGYHFQLQRDSNNTRLEVHWRIVQRYMLPGFDCEPYWGRLEEVAIGGKAVSTLPAEDLLMVLCLHAATHLWKRLKWICDISELICLNEDLDWGEIMYRARAERCERILSLSLLLAHDILGTVLPVEIMERVTGDSSTQTIAEQVKRRIFEDGTLSPLFLIKTADNMRDKIELGARIARDSITPTPAEWTIMSLPQPLSFLYRIIRLVRLFVIYVLNPWKERLTSAFRKE